ncbi:hypothetical protein EV127DRAFT_507432, partial [Xylaria flabelliformis]
MSQFPLLLQVVTASQERSQMAVTVEARMCHAVSPLTYRSRRNKRTTSGVGVRRPQGPSVRLSGHVQARSLPSYQNEAILDLKQCRKTLDRQSYTTDNSSKEISSLISRGPI